jgi:glycosidase
MIKSKMRSLLVQLYGSDAGEAAFKRLDQVLEKYRSRLPQPAARPGGLTQRDAILITYADQIQNPGAPSLRTLADFCERHLKGVVSGVHILPFYPWSSDDGFSVIDYRVVDARYGDWEDIRNLGKYFRLMFDAVINHISIGSAWFKGLLHGDERFRDFFVVPAQDADLTRVVRPRALPLLTTFSSHQGELKIWTTFSADQADLNYANPQVLLEIVDLLLFYASQGAEFIRLDAIAYLWKEAGTPSIHLPQTHWVIQLFRAVLDEVAPHVMLITETNVPHIDNISYFGDGTNEAQLVYNFSLPPLVLHAFQTGSAETLTRWSAGLELPSRNVTFFNFLASHDGIGLNPLRGILDEAEIEAVVNRVEAHGGLVSFKSGTDGARLAYELNVNYFDALNDPHADQDVDYQIERFVTAHAILLALAGVPGIYFHSLVGSRGWPEGVTQTGHNRSINRRKFRKDELESSLADPAARPARVLERLSHLLSVRAERAAFDPYGSQQVAQCPPAVFGLLRVSPDGRDRALCLHNVGSRIEEIDARHLKLLGNPSKAVRDLLTDEVVAPDKPVAILPFHTLWLA